MPPAQLKRHAAAVPGAPQPTVPSQSSPASTTRLPQVAATATQAPWASQMVPAGQCPPGCAAQASLHSSGAPAAMQPLVPSHSSPESTKPLPHCPGAATHAPRPSHTCVGGQTPPA